MTTLRNGPIVTSFVLALVLVLVLLVVVVGGASDARAASPSFSNATEDMLIDGDIDAEDLVGRATVGRGTSRRPPGGDTWISLAGFTRQTQGGEQEIGGFVVVALPFDRLIRVSARSSPSSAAPAGAVAAEGLVVSASAASAAAASAEDGTPINAVTPRLARSSVEAAWRAAGLGNDDARLDAIVSRARWSALLPETRLRAVRFDEQRLYTDATADTSRLRDTAGANVGLEARLTWRFDRLLYADDEPAFERMRLERHDGRSRIAGRVLEALFHWHRAWLELRFAQAASRDAREPPGRPTREEMEAALRVMEAEATLDVLTAGWFSSSPRSRASVARSTAPIGPRPASPSTAEAL